MGLKDELPGAMGFAAARGLARAKSSRYGNSGSTVGDITLYYLTVYFFKFARSKVGLCFFGVILIYSFVHEAFFDSAPAPDHGNAYGFLNPDAAAFRQMTATGSIDTTSEQITLTITNPTPYRIGDVAVKCSWDSKSFEGQETTDHSSQTYDNITFDPRSDKDSGAHGPIKSGETYTQTTYYPGQSTDQILSPVECKVVGGSVYQNRPQDKPAVVQAQAAPAPIQAEVRPLVAEGVPPATAPVPVSEPVAEAPAPIKQVSKCTIITPFGEVAEGKQTDNAYSGEDSWFMHQKSDAGVTYFFGQKSTARFEPNSPGSSQGYVYFTPNKNTGDSNAQASPAIAARLQDCE